MNDLESIIKSLTDRIRKLESGQEGNGFVPYFFVPRLGTLSNHDHHTVRIITAGLGCYIEIIIPVQVSSLEEAVLIYIPTGTGSWDYTISTEGGACGEDEQQHSDSITDDGEAVTDDEIECLDISGALTPYHAGDVVGVEIVCDVLTTTTAINVIGIRLR